MHKSSANRKNFVGEVVDVEFKEILPASNAKTYLGLPVGHIRAIPDQDGHILSPRILQLKATPIVDLQQVSEVVAEEELIRCDDELQKSAKGLVKAVEDFFRAAVRYDKADTKLRQLRKARLGR